ncbi:MAG TPA: alpha-L-arabinofuranosidase C-terminal domain-containing protein, partial [Chitinivibrionales bacterium]
AAHTVTVTLTSAPVYASCTATILNGPSFNSYNDFGAPENVNIQNFTGVTHTGNTVTVTMPAHSVVTVELKPAVGVLFRSVKGTNSSIAVGTTKGGTITVRSGSLRRMPFTLEL